MIINIFLQIIATFFTIIAVSLFPLKNEIKIFEYRLHKLFLANLFFYLANAAMLFFASLNGYIFLYVQMVFFAVLSYYGIRNFGNKKEYLNILKILLLIILVLTLLILFRSHGEYNNDFKEFIASVFAISGSYFLNIRKNEIMGYVLFLLADMLYFSFFAFQKGCLIITLQYLFFIMMNSKAIFNILRRPYFI